ncbi:uncharacterized protein Pyn_15889 [Prunus yedoensis var. nudiflora]|uniref:Uncharacterized protein n=1 Tax=Prunus yedoensis var. nudiflora TaxID=2094558 RepID=A0A314ZP68_PRUYE|nr:uncharacterized protein Pyn_15889 [Prunus yedoensis var. nudiflora]
MASWPSSSDPSNHILISNCVHEYVEREAAIRKRSPGSQFKFLVPLIYAPVLPLIRLSLRKNPVVRDRLFTAVLVGAFAHGFYLVTDLYDAESK